MRLIKTTFEFLTDDGTRIKRTLEDEDASIWYDWIHFMCDFNQNESWYPNFDNLNWKVSELRPKKKEVLSADKVLEQILEENSKGDK